MNQLKIDKQKGLYVLTKGLGVFPIGIGLLAKRAKALAQWMGIAEPKSEEGTPEHYTECMAMMDKGQLHAKRTGLKCTGNLNAQLVGYEGERVSVVDSAGQHRSFWVARTLGWMPGHLEIEFDNGEDGALASEIYQSVTLVA